MGLSGVYGARLLYREPSRRRLAVALAAMAAVVYLIRSAILLLRPEGSTDFQIYLAAAQALARGADPYAGFLRACPSVASCNGFTGYYIYPPLLALLMRPLVGLPLETAVRAWMLLDHLLFASAIVIAFRTVRRWLSVTAGASLLAAALLFLPVYENLYFMQVNMVLLVLLAAAAWALVAERGGVRAGVLLGAASVLRVTPLPLAAALVRSRAGLQRPWGWVAMGATGLGLLFVLRLATPYTWEYLTRVLPGLAASSGWVENQSMPGVLSRARQLAPGLAPLLAVVAPLLSLGMLGITWYRCFGPDHPRRRAAAFAAILAVIPIVSSVTEQHHLVAELLTYALIAPRLVPGRRGWWLAVLAYPLLWISHDDPFHAVLGLPPGALADRALAVVMLVPANLVGMVLLWLAALAALRSEPDRGEDAGMEVEDGAGQ